MEASPLVGVISTARQGNVQRMVKLCAGLDLVWFVNEGEGADYLEAGAAEIVELPVERPAVARARDAVLDRADAEGRVAVVLDDDLRSVKAAYRNEAGRMATRPSTVAEAIEAVIGELRARPGLYLGGVAPTSNLLYVRRLEKEPVKTLGFIRDLYVVLPGSGIRHDHDLELTEDYDFSIQHIERHGGMVRVDTFLPSFDKLTNRGGLQSAEVGRSPATIAAARERLAAKWPKYVTWPHPKKGPAEIEFRVDGRSMN